LNSNTDADEYWWIREISHRKPFYLWTIMIYSQDFWLNRAIYLLHLYFVYLTMFIWGTNSSTIFRQSMYILVILFDLLIVYLLVNSIMNSWMLIFVIYLSGAITDYEFFLLRPSNFIQMVQLRTGSSICYQIFEECLFRFIYPPK